MHLRLYEFTSTLVNPVTASSQRHDERRHLVLVLGEAGYEGFGELSPQPSTLNGDPGYDEVLDELQHHAVPALLQAGAREGAWPAWSRLSGFSASRAASRSAIALLEMATFDLQLRREHLRTTDRLPPRYSTPQRRSLGAGDQRWPDLAAVAEVRLKVTGDALSPDVLARVAAVGLPVLLDYNCAQPTFDDVVRDVADVSAVATLVAVEQPFAPGNLVDHALLAQRLDVPISIDEGVRTRRDLDDIARYGAAAMVCVKPPRVGGIAEARSLLAHAQVRGLQAYVGGFFESPLARDLYRDLAQASTSEASDIGPVDTEAPAPWRRVETGLGYELVAASAQLVGEWDLRA